MKILIALAVLLVAVSAFNEELSKKQFHEYIRKYNKQYTPDEYHMRLRNFRMSLARVAAKNKNATKPDDAVFGINQFSDMTPEEFRSTVLMSPRQKITPKQDRSKKDMLPGLPSFLDWREKGAVTAVKNQEQCGSCWAFSTTEAIESAWIIGGKGTNTTTILSPQQIVDCDTTDAGCDGGNPPTAYEYVISAGGLDSEASYPYTGEDGNCDFRTKSILSKISSYQYATSDYSESTLQKNLVNWGPLSICVDASNWQDYQSGVMKWYQCAWINELDHCVQLVGFNTNAATPYYMVRNSWTTQWGIDGYIWLEMGEDTCGLTYEATWPGL
jgi:C1A family cysteine protease